MVKLGMKVQTWDTLPKPNFVKITEGGIPLLGKFIPNRPVARLPSEGA